MQKCMKCGKVAYTEGGLCNRCAVYGCDNSLPRCKKCGQHTSLINEDLICPECYEFDTSDYIELSPDHKDKRIMELQRKIAEQDKVIVDLKRECNAMKASLINIDEMSKRALDLIKRGTGK